MQCIDAVDGYLSLIPLDGEDGEQREDVRAPAGADGAALRKALDEGKDVIVTLRLPAAGAKDQTPALSAWEAADPA